MTTICYHANVMAADSQITLGNYKTLTDKIYGIPGLGVIGFAGDAGMSAKILDWWKSGRVGPAPEPTGDAQVQGILVTKEGLFYLYDGITPLIIKAPYLAIGSGQDYCITALEMGMSAKKAIEEAIKHDVYTSGPIIEIECSAFFENETPPRSSKRKPKTNGPKTKPKSRQGRR